MKKKAIVLFSGGQDSATCLFWAKDNFDEVIAIGFDYGQKHKVELEQAKHICEKYARVEYRVINIEGLLSGSALTDHSQDVSAQHKINKDLPATFTAGRNALFLAIVSSLAYNEGISDIVTGTCQTDFSGYPDCRRKFIDSMQLSMTLALDQDMRIHTPLMYLTKAQTWELAWTIGRNVFEIIRTLTMTDYNGDRTMNEWGMGVENNPAANLRAKGFREFIQMYSEKNIDVMKELHAIHAE